MARDPTERCKFFVRRVAGWISRRPEPSSELVAMVNEEDWLWRPVIRGMIRAEALIDPKVSLDFIADCNDALDVQDENDYRIMEANR